MKTWGKIFVQDVGSLIGLYFFKEMRPSSSRNESYIFRFAIAIAITIIGSFHLVVFSVYCIVVSTFNFISILAVENLLLVGSNIFYYVKCRNFVSDCVFYPIHDIYSTIIAQIMVIGTAVATAEYYDELGAFHTSGS